MLDKKTLFFIDAETDGLYGAFISVAIVVLDPECNEIERHYLGIKKEKLKVENDWVKKNVLPILGDYKECEDEDELLSCVWDIWNKYSDNSYAIADVAYPVEMRLFEKCIMKDPNNRAFKGPYPFIDLSSILMARNIDPMMERSKIVSLGDSRQHNAMDDVDISIKLWKELM